LNMSAPDFAPLTVISFQKVVPGARERLVQITGPDQNIKNIKHNLERQTKFGRGTWGKRGHCWGGLEWLVARLVRPGLVSTNVTLEELPVPPAVFSVNL